MKKSSQPDHRNFKVCKCRLHKVPGVQLKEILGLSMVLQNLKRLSPKNKRKEVCSGNLVLNGKILEL
jgi:hypothetical protein